MFSHSKVSKGAKIRSRYNQVPHPTQDTNGKVTNSQLDTTNESQEVSPFPAGDHKAQINRRTQRHSKHKTEQKHKRSTKASFGHQFFRRHALKQLAYNIRVFNRIVSYMLNVTFFVAFFNAILTGSAGIDYIWPEFSPILSESEQRGSVDSKHLRRLA